MLIHSFWVYSGLPNEMVREKRHIASSGAFRMDSEAFRDVKALEQLVHDIDAASSELTTWYIREFLGVWQQRRD